MNEKSPAGKIVVNACFFPAARMGYHKNGLLSDLRCGCGSRLEGLSALKIFISFFSAGLKTASIDHARSALQKPHTLPLDTSCTDLRRCQREKRRIPRFRLAMCLNPRSARILAATRLWCPVSHTSTSCLYVRSAYPPT